MESTVVIPDTLLKIEDGVEQNAIIKNDDSPVLVIYFSRTNCHACSINNLENYRSLYELSMKESSFDVMTIFSPYQANNSNIRKLLLEKEIEFPVFIDAENVMECQGVIPSASKYHIFLLSPEGKPIFVGNPYVSERVLNKFLKIASKYN